MTSATGAPPRPPMDPRLRERRIEVRRQDGRRRLRVLVGCAVVLALIAAAVGATRSPLLAVREVEVRGAQRTTRAAVVAASGLGRRPLMVEVDTVRAARRVEALPWVREARARRQWPNTVDIELTERRPAAVVPVGEGARWAVLDVTGRVLELTVAKPAGLPVVGGLDQEPGRPDTTLRGAVGPALRVAAALPASLRPRVADVAAVPGGEVELQLQQPGGVVRLGEPTDLGAKLVALRAVLDEVPLKGLAVLDLRVPSSPVLTRR